MMMDRDKLSFWVRIVAILLSVIFIGSFVFMGVGSNIPISILDLIGNNSQQQQQGGATTSTEDQIKQLRQEIEDNPKDAESYTALASLYYQSGQYDEAESVLKKGREAAPKDPDIAMLLGQIYYQRAESSVENQQEAYGKAGDAFAAAAKVDPEEEQAYLLAGEAYSQAGQTDQAIKYWNGYLDREPEGRQADEIKKRISELLRGGESTSGP